jgi:hypothetical protein
MAIDRKRAAQWGRIGGLRLRATRDPKEYTAAAREAALRRFETQVDPDELLDPKERAKRAEAAKRAYFSELAIKSAEARRGRARSPQKNDGRHGALEAFASDEAPMT